MLRAIQLFLLLLFVCAPAGSRADRRLAFVVGNGAYLHAARLANPAHDARAMTKVLEGLGFQVVLAIDQGKTGMEEAFRGFLARLEGADVALFFYAGHGFQSNGRNYIVPVDADIEIDADLDLRALEVQRLIELIEERARVGLAFLDACRTNPFANYVRKIGARSSDRGLVPMTLARGEMLIAFATSPGRIAADGANGNSPFTTALLENIATPGIDVQSMLRRVVRMVEERTENRQTPWQHSSLKSDVYLAGRPAPPAAILSPASSPSTDARRRPAAACRRSERDRSGGSGEWWALPPPWSPAPS